jgi:heavy metal translocating P-type ATPase
MSTTTDSVRGQQVRHMSIDVLLLGSVTALLAAGGIAALLGASAPAKICWAMATVVGLVPAIIWAIEPLRAGKLGADLIAVLALAGSLGTGEQLAGAIIALMLASGRALEDYAGRRARRDLSTLVERAPRTARRREPNGLRVVPVADVRVGDQLLIGTGEVVPVDGRVIAGMAVLDESALTGEPLPVERGPTEPVRSGTVNAGRPIEITATNTAAESAYAAIVRLARAAEAGGAPVVRLADRYAGIFLPVTLAIAGAAWLGSGDPVTAVAVLVVATPCPLLLAAPAAIVSGLSVAARLGVIVKGGAALEQLGRVRTVVLDKTGTLTVGRPTVVDVVAAPAARHTPTDLLALAAAVEQGSPHVIGAAIVQAAKHQRLPVAEPQDVVDQPGDGVSGRVEGALVRVGRRTARADDPAWMRDAAARAELEGASTAWIDVDGEPAGVILLLDVLRADASRTLRRLRRAGVQRIVMLTGDRATSAQAVARLLSLDVVLADRDPAGKVAAVRAERSAAVTAMVGDGVNDAPALAAAQVGVAMAGRGGGASAEAADVVLVTDRISRLADAVTTARRARGIAVQSAVVGMGLSMVAMVVAAFGAIPPAIGALLQELIDVAVILNALRALGSARIRDVAVPPATVALIRRMQREHAELRPGIHVVRSLAGRLGDHQDSAELRDDLARLRQWLADRLLPHERTDEHELYPLISSAMGSPELTDTMSRAHAEIDRLVTRLGWHVDHPAECGGAEDLRATLYGLYALLALHFSQEEEAYHSLVDEEPGADDYEARSAVSATAG